MKICFLTNELSGKDGWSRYSVSLINQLLKKGIDCQVLVSEKAGDNILKNIKDHKILPYFGSRINKVFSLIKNFFKIRKLIRDSDIVHVLVEPYALIPFLVMSNKLIFITLHGTYAITPFKKWYLKYIYKKVFKEAKKIFCVSRFTQQEFFKKIKTDNTLVINNGIDFKKFQISKKIEKKNQIISVGALKFRKGYHISIPAFANVKKKYPNLKYYIIGNQENKKYFKELKDLINKHKLKDDVIFLENISNQELIESYYQSKLFILTPVNDDSSVEGFGLVYLEANACGLPVIGTYNCGAEEAIKNNLTGLLISQNNIKKTSQAILKILDNSDLVKKISINSYKEAKQMDWSNIINKYIKIYRNL